MVPNPPSIAPPLSFREVQKQEDTPEQLQEIKIERAEAITEEFSEDALALKASRSLQTDWRIMKDRGWLRYGGDSRPVWESVTAPLDICRIVCRDESQAAVTPVERRRIQSAKTASAVLKLVEHDPRHEMLPDQFDADPDILITPAGAIDLRTFETKPSGRSYYSTMITSASRASGKPEKWLDFLKWATDGSAELQSDLQRAAGYFLTGHTNEERMHFLYGTGGNGKGTFINTLSSIMGTYAREASSDVFLEQRFAQHPTALAGLKGARLVTATELSQGRVWNTSLVKHLTGGDKISARYMNHDFFEFKPNFKLVISGNHKPELPSVDEAMRRRILLVPFQKNISDAERDTGLKATLLKESGQILEWMLEGCAEWRVKTLAPSSEILNASSEYLADEDSIGNWMAECCRVGEGNEDSSSALFESWSKWRKESNEDPGSQKAFSQELSNRPGLVKSRNARVRGFSGIALLSNIARGNHAEK